MSIATTGCQFSEAMIQETEDKVQEPETVFIEGVIQSIDERMIHIKLYDDTTKSLYAPVDIMLPQNISVIPFEFECIYDDKEEQWIIVNMGVLE